MFKNGADMAKYSEEDIKSQVRDLFFPRGKFDISQNRLDFAIADKSGNAIFWAESKKGSGVVSKWAMLAQLLLTIKPRLDTGEMPPSFIGCFDESEITFCEFFHAQDVLTTNDFNWNERPSNVSQKSADKVASILGENVYTFNWKTDAIAAKEFVKNNLHARGLFDDQSLLQYVQITKNNFVQIFNRWRNEVLPTIAIPNDFYESGLIDGDFFLADVLSDKDKTISKKLKILLNKDQYELNIKQDLFNRINFRDNGAAYRRFWTLYVRPPKEEYWEYIRTRRDLLVPSGIRERKGAYFTPQLWVQKSQEYMARAFGENWQDEYFVWDCCAGTGNLLEGLVNPERVWASTLDAPDIQVMKENPRLFENQCFQFDFLNDSFDKLPKPLQKIIIEQPEKLIIYINPPYAEATTKSTISSTGRHKVGVATNNKTSDKYKELLGSASNEIFVAFIIRIYLEIPGCKLGLFSKLKIISAPNFSRFRNVFLSKYLGGFVVHADTFDNVVGQFPIGFTIWDLSNEQQISDITCDIVENDGHISGTKKFIAYNDNVRFINDWTKTFVIKNKPEIGTLNLRGNDFQHQNLVFIADKSKSSAALTHLSINENNLKQVAIYLAVRHCIPTDWLNDRDQFLYPNDDWQYDKEFQNDCLAFTLFHSQNRIDSRQDTNHWIPYRPSEVGARDNFESNFMSDFLKGREFSPAAQVVLDAGRNLWTYYQKDMANVVNGNVNAGLYEIREYYRGRTDAGRLRSKSDDTQFQALDDALKSAVAALAPKIEPKIYEYGFLKK